QAETGAAVLYITHDLGIVAQITSRIAVIYGGSIVEEGETARVLRSPRHFYTRMLLASAPNPFSADARLHRRLVSFHGLPPDLHAPPPGCIFAARCPAVRDACREGVRALDGPPAQRSACLRADDAAGFDLFAAEPVRPVIATGAAEAARAEAPLFSARDVRVEYVRHPLLDQIMRRPASRVSAVAGISFTLAEGETLGLIGESGCGKSTLARALVGLRPFSGRLRLGDLAAEGGAAFPPGWRRAAQIVFQHPDQSLNPRMRVGEIIGRPLRLHQGLAGAALEKAAAAWLDRVRLPGSYARRFPHELSGGEKQRVAIARAFAPGPRLVVADEVTSGLDVSVQAAILNLLAELQETERTAMILISHDLNMVQRFADRIAVMYLGQIVEERRVGGPLAPPMHPYSEALLAAAPVPEPGLAARRVRLDGALPSPANPPPGCRFTTRCPRRLGDVCDTAPPWRALGPGHRALCHVEPAALAAIPPIWDRADSGAEGGPDREGAPP
ncbi:MAG: ATP-binding cassette domain-containing protein, partial [Alphaproteobacteria bacterium]|nr:ATP-binding cassette domain-containing protein [Alphaproteobacteria bacterium]